MIMSRWGREAGERAWKSPPAGGARRGIVLPVSYTAATRGSARSIFTVRTSSGSFSFMPVDLDTGPILAPEYGFFIRALPRKPVETAAVKPAAVPPPPGMLEAKLTVAGAAGEIAGLRGWGSRRTPMIYANDGKEPAMVGPGAVLILPDDDLPEDLIDPAKAAAMRNAAVAPPRSVVAYPGPELDIAVGWRSPIAGKVSVKAKVADEFTKAEANEQRYMLAATGATANGGR